MLAAVLGIRYGLLEAGAFPLDCGNPLVAGVGSSCAAKWILVQSFVQQRLGWLSLACGIAAFASRHRRLALVGWFAGLAGLILYSFDPAAVGALLSLLVLVRAPAQRRRCEDEAGEQPGDRLGVGRLG